MLQSCATILNCEVMKNPFKYLGLLVGGVIKEEMERGGEECEEKTRKMERQVYLYGGSLVPNKISVIFCIFILFVII